MLNKPEKQVIKFQLNKEQAAINDLERQYKQALRDIEDRIKLLQSDELTQSRIYQIQYQKALRGQIEGILDKLQGDEYATIQKYLHDSYQDGFIGTMYSIHGQGIPLILPLDQNAAVKAVITDSQISEGLYNHLGVNIKQLKQAIRQEITRGLAANMPFADIARNISNRSKAPLSRAKTIVRTEGHRIQQASANDARETAKANGCNVVKQWDGTLDGDTRPTHRRLDGQIRETDKPFEMDGKKAMYPGDFGKAEEDCNCRCVALTRAKWALDEDELKTLKERAKFFELDKKDDFKTFEEKYLKAAERSQIQQRSKKPTRPRRSDYDDDEAYEAAREQYRLDRERYKAEVDKIVQADLNRDRKYVKPADVKEWAKTNSVNITDDVLERLDTRTFDDVIEVQEEMFKRFPQGKKGWELYGNKYTIDVVDGTYEFMSANGGLNFNGRYFSDFEDALKEAIDMQDRGVTVYGDGSFKTFLRHEYGHNVDDYIKMHRFNSLYEGKRNAPFEPQRRSEYERELLELANHSGASEYAKTNSNEAFAEGFAEYTSNPKSEFGKAFGEFLGRWMVD